MGDRPDSTNVRQTPLPDSGAKVRDGSQIERAGDREHAIRREPDQPPEADQLRVELPLEITQLCDLTGLDELAQTRLDPLADSSEPPDLPRAHESHDRRGR